jgi:hypothetical protein
VTLASGGAAPVVWIGSRRVDCGRHPKPETVMPVRVARGAFGANVPERDLYLSPGHAVFVDGVLVPVRYLIDGETIAQVTVDSITYHHVELPNHDVVLAEGLPSESYLDTREDTNFARGGRPVRLHPDFAARSWETMGCAPIVVAGERLAAIRGRLAAGGTRDQDPIRRTGMR